jgi:peroxiredoxin Q/BCP
MSPRAILRVGDPAPDFNLPAVPGGQIQLRQFHGKSAVVLYFYPRDDTPGCTAEACDFRDQWSSLQAQGVVVLGVSTDSPQSHERFQKKYELPFPLLSDEDHRMCEAYGVWVEKNLYGKKSLGVQRATFLVDQTGRIAAVWPKVRVKGHVADVAAKAATLGNPQ